MYGRCVELKFEGASVRICPTDSRSYGSGPIQNWRSRTAGASLKQALLEKKAATDVEADAFYNGAWQQFKQDILAATTAPLEAKNVLMAYFESWTDIYNSKLVKPSLWYTLLVKGMDNAAMNSAMKAMCTNGTC